LHGVRNDWRQRAGAARERIGLGAERRQAPFGKSRQDQLIEMQTSSCLGEDDIERIEDDCHRS